MNINGRYIAVERKGSGAPLLLVHGLGGTSNFWWPAVRAFESDYELIVPDLPSAGRSQLDAAVSIATIAGDLLALMDELEFDQFHLAGHSMGTIVCQHMAAAAPERILDLVLLGPLAEPPEPARGALRDRAGVARRDGMSGIADAIANAALAAETKAGNTNIQAFVREMVLRQPSEGYASSCEALAGAQKADPAAIKCDSLLITGDQDGVAPPAAVQQLAADLGAKEPLVLSACGHWTLTEQPDAVLAAMRTFYN